MLTRELMQRFHEVFQEMYPQKDYFDFLGILPRSEMAILRTIVCEQKVDRKVTVTAIAQRLDISKPAVSRTLRQLLAKGFIELQQDENDRRNNFVLMTEQGKLQYDRTNQKVHAYIAEVFERMDQAELIQFIETAERIVYMMTQVKQDYEPKEVTSKHETNG